MASEEVQSEVDEHEQLTLADAEDAAAANDDPLVEMVDTGEFKRLSELTAAEAGGGGYRVRRDLTDEDLDEDGAPYPF